jgi:hypothetical protein
MHRSLFHKSCAAAALALAFSATTATAAGLLGSRYVSASYDYTLSESASYKDGDGVSLFYNHPFADHVDLGLDFRARSVNGSRNDVPDVEDQRLRLVATAYQSGGRDNIFVRLGVGFGSVERGSRDSTTLAWSAVIGTEYTFSESAVLQPYAGWNDVRNDGQTISFIYGALVAYDVTDAFSVTGQIEGDEHYNVTLSIGALVRF